MTIRVSCVGDSITRAQHSVDYLSLLGARHRPGEVSSQRFGVNRDFAYNLLQRLDEVVAAPADVITVLIGTNDARASLPGYPVDRVMTSKQLPTKPCAAWFQECLDGIVERLSAETDAAIGLLSLPVLGQDPAAPPAQASKEYSRMIAEIAQRHDIAYLPLHERQIEEIQRENPAKIPYEELTVASQSTPAPLARPRNPSAWTASPDFVEDGTVSKYDDDLLRRVARLYRIPGVTAVEVCARLGVTRYAIDQATKRFGGRPSPQDLVLAALTKEGRSTRGPWPTANRLRTMASWVDYVNKDGSTVEAIEAILDNLVDVGALRREGSSFVLMQPFP